jgi:hypothetical protein
VQRTKEREKCGLLLHFYFNGISEPSVYWTIYRISSTYYWIALNTYIYEHIIKMCNGQTMAFGDSAISQSHKRVVTSSDDWLAVKAREREALFFFHFNFIIQYALWNLSLSSTFLCGDINSGDSLHGNWHKFCVTYQLLVHGIVYIDNMRSVYLLLMSQFAVSLHSFVLPTELHTNSGVIY